MHRPQCLFVLLACLLETGVAAAKAHDQASAATPNGAMAPRITGSLHTSGMKILDQNNRPIRLLAVNISGMEWGAGKPWTSSGCPENRLPRNYGCYSVENGPLDQEMQRVEEWGFNVVRLPVSWANLEPEQPSRQGNKITHKYNAAYVAALDQIIRGLNQHHVAVILSMHQWAWSPALHPEGKNSHLTEHGLGLPVWLYEQGGWDQMRARREFFTNQQQIHPGYPVWDGLADAWTFLAAHYKDNPMVVGADLFNEPYPGMEGQKPHVHYSLGPFFQHIGEAVHRASPDLLLIFEDDGRTPVRELPNLPNLVYSYHSYPHQWDPDGHAKLEKQLAHARAWNVPLWIGEFDDFGEKSEGGVQPNLPEMMRDCKQAVVGWSYWAYWRASRPLLEKGKKPGPPNMELIRMLQRGF